MEEITLDRLFRPTKQVEVGGKSLRVRALSGPEQEARSLYGTNQARKVEKELADAESDIYQTRIKGLEDLSPEELTTIIRTSKSIDFRRELELVNPIKYIPFPDEATDEEKKAVLNEREAQIPAHKEKLDELTKTKTDEYVASLVDKSPEELLKLARACTIKSIANGRASSAYVYHTLYSATYSEDKRYFSSATDASELADSVVFMLYREIESLNSIDPLALGSKLSS